MKPLSVKYDVEVAVDMTAPVSASHETGTTRCLFTSLYRRVACILADRTLRDIREADALTGEVKRVRRTGSMRALGVLDAFHGSSSSFSGGLTL